MLATVLLLGAMVAASAAEASDPRVECLQTMSVTVHAVDTPCDAVEAYGQCLADIDFDALDAQGDAAGLTNTPHSRFWMALQRFQKQYECGPFSEQRADINEKDEKLVLTGRDIRFRRNTDEDASSIFELQQQIERLKALAEKLLSAQDVSARQAKINDGMTANAASTTIQDELSAPNAAMLGLVTDAADTITSEAQEKENDLRDEVVDASALDGLKSMVDDKIRDINNLGNVDTDGILSNIAAEAGVYESGVTAQATGNLLGATGAEIDSMIAAVSSRMSQLLSKVSGLKSRTTSRSSKADKLGDDLDTEMAKVTAALATDPKHHYLSAYCNRHDSGNFNSWRVYCLTNSEFNNAGDYFAIENANSGLIRIKKTGLYRINMWTISYCGSWAHMGVFVNGWHRHHGHEHSHGTWTDNFADLTLPLRASDAVDVRIYCSGGAWGAYHHGSATGTHSRLQVHYIGEWTPEYNKAGM